MCGNEQLGVMPVGKRGLVYGNEQLGVMPAGGKRIGVW